MTGRKRGSNPKRWLIRSIAAAFIVAGSSAWARDAVFVEAIKLYGGTYSIDCGNAAAPRLRATADALIVEQGGKRMTGRNVQAAYSYFGNSPPPNYQVVLLSDVQAGVALEFIVYRDKAGLYITLEGDPKILAALGKPSPRQKYRDCDAGRRQGAAQAPPPAPARPPSSEAMGTAGGLLRDARFRSAYYRALGPMAREQWLARLDGPSPESRKLNLVGTEYVLAGACKNHDCFDHNTVLLYSAAQGVVYGKVFQRGRSTLIGAPPPAVARELDRLWRAQWRQQ